MKLVIFFILKASFILLLISTLNVGGSASFLIVLVFYLILSWYAYSRKSLALVNIAIFIYFFFLLSPIVQFNYRNSYLLVNTFVANAEILWVINIMITIFIGSLIVSYHIRQPKIAIRTFVGFSKTRVFLIYLILILILLSFGVKYFYEKYSLAAFLQSHDESKQLSLAYSLIIQKFLLVIPSAIGFIILMKNKSSIPSIFFALLLILYFKNPIVEHRNGFGPIWLSLFFILFLHHRSFQSVIVACFALFLFGFPLGELLAPHRNVDSTLVEIFTRNYNTIHWDAWANIAGAIGLVDVAGHTSGYQTLSSLLFFVPRALWEAKGVASAEILGVYLMDHYSHWMTNISFPILAEGYLEFGIVGVVAVGALVGQYCKFIDYLTTKSDFKFVGIYLSFTLIFMMRGPLLPYIAYTSGAVIAFVFVSLLMPKVKTLVRLR